MNSITPRTDEDVRLCKVISESFGPMVGADFAGKMETELNEANETIRACEHALREAVRTDKIGWLQELALKKAAASVAAMSNAQAERRG